MYNVKNYLNNLELTLTSIVTEYRIPVTVL